MAYQLNELDTDLRSYVDSEVAGLASELSGALEDGDYDTLKELSDAIKILEDLDISTTLTSLQTQINSLNERLLALEAQPDPWLDEPMSWQASAIFGPAEQNVNTQIWEAPDAIDQATIDSALGILQNGWELRYSYGPGEDDLDGTDWGDAGGDMYDGGNQVWIDNQIQDFWTSTSSLEFQSETWGQFAFANSTSGQVLAIRNFIGNKFVIDGDIGADGNGSRATGELTGYAGLRVFYDQVYDAGDTSINKIIITDATSPSLISVTNTDDDTFGLDNIGDATFVIYVLLAGDQNIDNGYRYTESELRSVVSQMLSVESISSSQNGVSRSVVVGDDFESVVDGYDPSTITLTVTTPLSVAQAVKLAQMGFNLETNVTYSIEDWDTDIQGASLLPQALEALRHAELVTAKGDELDNAMRFTSFDQSVNLRIEADEGNDRIDAGRADDDIVGQLGGDTIYLTSNDQSADDVIYQTIYDGRTLPTVGVFWNVDLNSGLPGSGYLAGTVLYITVNGVNVSYAVDPSDTSVREILENFAQAIENEEIAGLGSVRVSYIANGSDLGEAALVFYGATYNSVLNIENGSINGGTYFDVDYPGVATEWTVTFPSDSDAYPDITNGSYESEFDRKISITIDGVTITADVVAGNPGASVQALADAINTYRNNNPEFADNVIDAAEVSGTTLTLTGYTREYNSQETDPTFDVTDARIDVPGVQQETVVEYSADDADYYSNGYLRIYIDGEEVEASMVGGNASDSVQALVDEINNAINAENSSINGVERAILEDNNGVLGVRLVSSTEEANPWTATGELDFRGERQEATFSLETGGSDGKYSSYTDGDSSSNRLANVYFSGGEVHLTVRSSSDPSVEVTVSAAMAQAETQTISGIYNGAAGGDGVTVYQTVQFSQGTGPSTEVYRVQFVATDLAGNPPGAQVALAFHSAAKFVAGTGYVAYVGDESSVLEQLAADLGVLTVEVNPNAAPSLASISITGAVGFDEVHTIEQVKYTTDSPSNLTGNSTNPDINSTSQSGSYTGFATNTVLVSGGPGAASATAQNLADVINTLIDPTDPEYNSVLAGLISSASASGNDVRLVGTAYSKESFEIADVRLDYEGAPQISTVELDSGTTYSATFLNGGEIDDSSYSRGAGIYYVGGKVYLKISEVAEWDDLLIGGTAGVDSVIIEANMGEDATETRANLIDAINAQTGEDGDLEGLISSAATDGSYGIKLTAAQNGDVTFAVNDIALDYQGTKQKATAEFSNTASDYYADGTLSIMIDITPDDLNDQDTSVKTITANMVANSASGSLENLRSAIEDEIGSGGDLDGVVGQVDLNATANGPSEYINSNFTGSDFIYSAASIQAKLDTFGGFQVGPVRWEAYTAGPVYYIATFSTDKVYTSLSDWADDAEAYFLAEGIPDASISYDPGTGVYSFSTSIFIAQNPLPELRFANFEYEFALTSAENEELAFKIVDAEISYEGVLQEAKVSFSSVDADYFNDGSGDDIDVNDGVGYIGVTVNGEDFIQEMVNNDASDTILALRDQIHAAIFGDGGGSELPAVIDEFTGGTTFDLDFLRVQSGFNTYQNLDTSFTDSGGTTTAAGFYVSTLAISYTDGTNFFVGYADGNFIGDYYSGVVWQENQDPDTPDTLNLTHDNLFSFISYLESLTDSDGNLFLEVDTNVDNQLVFSTIETGSNVQLAIGLTLLEWPSGEDISFNDFGEQGITKFDGYGESAGESGGGGYLSYLEESISDVQVSGSGDSIIFTARDPVDNDAEITLSNAFMDVNGIIQVTEIDLSEVSDQYFYTNDSNGNPGIIQFTIDGTTLTADRGLTLDDTLDNIKAAIDTANIAAVGSVVVDDENDIVRITAANPGLDPLSVLDIGYEVADIEASRFQTVIFTLPNSILDNAVAGTMISVTLNGFGDADYVVPIDDGNEEFWTINAAERADYITQQLVESMLLAYQNDEEIGAITRGTYGIEGFVAATSDDFTGNDIDTSALGFSIQIQAGIYGDEVIGGIQDLILEVDRPSEELLSWDADETVIGNLTWSETLSSDGISIHDDEDDFGEVDARAGEDGYRTGDGDFGEDAIDIDNLYTTGDDPDPIDQTFVNAGDGDGEDENSDYLGDSPLTGFGEDFVLDGIQQDFVNPDGDRINFVTSGEDTTSYYGDDEGEDGSGIKQTFTNPDSGYDSINDSPAYNGEDSNFGDESLYGSNPGWYDEDGLNTTYLNGATTSGEDYYTNRGEDDLSDKVNIYDGSGEDSIGVTGGEESTITADDDDGEDSFDYENTVEGENPFYWDESQQVRVADGNDEPDVIYDFQVNRDRIVIEASLAQTTLSGEDVQYGEDVDWITPEDGFFSLNDHEFGIISAADNLEARRAVLDSITIDFWSGEDEPTNEDDIYAIRTSSLQISVDEGETYHTYDIGAFDEIEELITKINQGGIVNAEFDREIGELVITEKSLDQELVVRTDLRFNWDDNSSRTNIDFSSLNGEFATTLNYTDVTVAELDSAVDIAELLNSSFEFSHDSYADEVLNTSIFAITAHDDSSKTAIWAHLQSHDGDNTVDANELNLLAIVNTTGGEFTWRNLDYTYTVVG